MNKFDRATANLLKGSYYLIQTALIGALLVGLGGFLFLVARALLTRMSKQRRIM